MRVALVDIVQIGVAEFQLDLKPPTAREMNARRARHAFLRTTKTRGIHINHADP